MMACKHGHIDERRANGTCKGCDRERGRKRDYRAEWQARKNRSGIAFKYGKLPVEPLVPYMPEAGTAWGFTDDWAAPPSIRSLLGETLERAYYRGKREGYLSLHIADQIACALGRHPIEVWGDAWDEDV